MKPYRWLFGLGVLVLILGTASECGVTGKDEYWVTMRTPLEMMDANSYWTLRLNDEVRLQKPPLVYWFLTALFTVLDPRLWVARLVGVLSGAGMAVVAARLYERLFKRSGATAGLAVLATAGVAVEGRRAMLDMPLGFFCVLAVYLALKAFQEKKSLCWVGSGMALAAATMSKGPQSLLFVMPALLLGAWLASPRPSARHWIRAAMLAGIPFVLLAAPWPVSMRILHADFIEELQNQIVTGRLSRISLSSPLSALGGALLLAFPWSFLLLHALIRGIKSHRNRKELWLCGWLLLSILPFFFMKSFERYMIPILPCAGILIARTLEEISDRARRIHVGVAAGLLSLVAVVFSGFGWWFHLTTWTTVLTLAATGFLWFTAWKHPTPRRSVSAVILVFTVVLGILYPRFGINRLPDDLPWEELKKHQVGIYSRYSQPAMLSMRLGQSVEWAREDRMNANGFNGYIFTTRDQLIDPDPRDDKIDYLDHALNTAGIPFEVAGSYPVLFSRRNWIRFTRPDAGPEAWRTAFRNRSLEGLKSEIVYVRAGSHPENTYK